MNQTSLKIAGLAAALAFTAGCARQGESDEEPDAAATDAQGEASSANAAASDFTLRSIIRSPSVR